MKNIHTKIILVLFVLATVYSFVQIILNINGMEASTSSETIWALIFATLVAMWANKEPLHKSFDAPFEFSAFVFFLWPLVLPYYLFKTRGSEGLVLFAGFVALYLAPFLCGLTAYVYLS